MQNKKRYTFFKIISGIVLIQGVLQLLNFLTIIMNARTLVTSASATKFYLGAILVGAYAIAAIIGGYAGVKDGSAYESLRKCFYVSIILILITCATLILNVIFKAYSATQFQALIIPVIFMLFTILCGRKN